MTTNNFPRESRDRESLVHMADQPFWPLAERQVLADYIRQRPPATYPGNVIFKPERLFRGDLPWQRYISATKAIIMNRMSMYLG